MQWKTSETRNVDQRKFNNDQKTLICLFHIVKFRFGEMLRNWFTATVDIIVIVNAYLFLS